MNLEPTYRELMAARFRALMRLPNHHVLEQLSFLWVHMYSTASAVVIVIVIAVVIASTVIYGRHLWASFIVITSVTFTLLPLPLVRVTQYIGNTVALFDLFYGY